MSENVDGTPTTDDKVAKTPADEEALDEAARSFPEEGSDGDPASMMNH